MSPMERWVRVVVPALLQRLIAGLPPRDQVWGQAMLAELAALEEWSAWWEWALGGGEMLIRMRWRRWAEDGRLWALAVALGSLLAYADLQSATRHPRTLMLFFLAGAFAFVRPRDPWRWALALAGCLPAITVLTGYWGPYDRDRFDTCYGLVPALLGAFLGAWIHRQRGWPEDPGTTADLA